MSNQEQNSWAGRRGTFTQLLVGVTGAAIAAGLQIAVPTVDPTSLRRLENGPQLLRWMAVVPHLLSQYYVQVAIFLVFGCLAAYKREQPGAWRYAFMAGLGFPEVVIFHWLK